MVTECQVSELLHFQ